MAPLPASARGSRALLLGWQGPSHHAFGFQRRPGPPAGNEQPLWYDGDKHLLCVAPTRSGKGRGVPGPQPAAL